MPDVPPVPLSPPVVPLISLLTTTTPPPSSLTSRIPLLDETNDDEIPKEKKKAFDVDDPLSLVYSDGVGLTKEAIDVKKALIHAAAIAAANATYQISTSTPLNAYKPHTHTRLNFTPETGEWF